jgi:hypothetical protein
MLLASLEKTTALLWFEEYTKNPLKGRIDLSLIFRVLLLSLTDLIRAHIKGASRDKINFYLISPDKHTTIFPEVDQE